jgi:hypothetical protein
METVHIFVFLPNKSGTCTGWDGTHMSRKPVAEVRIEVWHSAVYIRPNSYQVCQECLNDILDKYRNDRKKVFIIRDLRFAISEDEKARIRSRICGIE